jgi:tetratricopeptide (TPR) repeat protein
LKLAPSYTAAHLYRGQWLLDLDRVEEAGEAFGAAARLDADESSAWVGIARVHLKSDRPAEALELLTRLVAQSSGDPYIYQLVGQSYRALGDLENAKAALSKAKPSRGPAFSDPWHAERLNYRSGFGGGMLRAAELMKQNKVTEAVTLMEQLRAQDPDDRQLINNLSVAYRNIGQVDRAFSVLQDGLRRHPDYYPFHLNISADYQRIEDNEKALFHLERVLEISPTFALAYERIGNIQLYSGNSEKALVAFLQAERHDPDNATYALYSGVMLSRQERWAEAIDHLTRATELNPGLASAWIPLGSAQAELRRFGAAKVSLDRAQALAPDSQFLDRARKRLAELQGKS